jgi:uncharacterized coiled-coil DUF342 family protein
MTIIEERFMNQVIQIPNLIRELVQQISELNNEVAELKEELKKRNGE